MLRSEPDFSKFTADLAWPGAGKFGPTAIGYDGRLARVNASGGRCGRLGVQR
jgi:hypothetical protein